VACEMKDIARDSPLYYGTVWCLGFVSVSVLAHGDGTSLFLYSTLKIPLSLRSL